MFDRKFLFPFIVTAVYFVIVLFGTNHHELWGDELQAWAIARESTGILDLVLNKIRYEGHPALWHFMLYVLSSMFANPYAMQLLHAVIAGLTVYVFARYSPFTNLQKILFIFGYFTLFEYALISRPYGLGICLGFIFCTLYNKRDDHPISIGIILGFLANTSLFGSIMACGFWVLLLTDFRWNLKGARRSFYIITTIFSFGIAFAFLIMAFPLEKGLYPTWYFHFVVGRLSYFNHIWDAFVPLPVPELCFWNTNIRSLLIDGHPVLGSIIFALLSLFLLVITAYMTKSDRAVLISYCFVVFSILIFQYLKYPGNLRHQGYLYEYWIMCLWLSGSHHLKQTAPTQVPILYRNCWGSHFLTAILALHAIAGIYAYAMDIVHPFSKRQALAEYIERKYPQTLVAAFTDINAGAISATIGRPVYHLGSNRLATYTIYDKQFWNKADCTDLLDRLFRLASDHGEVLLVVSRPLTCSDPRLIVQLENTFLGGIHCVESVYAFEVSLSKDKLNRE